MLKPISPLFLAIAILTGCGGAPNNDDLRAAIAAQVKAVAGSRSVDANKDIINSMEIIACKKADSNGYNCDWKGAFGANSGRLVKSDSGWVIVSSQN